MSVDPWLTLVRHLLGVSWHLSVCWLTYCLVLIDFRLTCRPTCCWCHESCISYSKVELVRCQSIFWQNLIDVTSYVIWDSIFNGAIPCSSPCHLNSTDYDFFHPESGSTNQHFLSRTGFRSFWLWNRANFFPEQMLFPLHVSFKHTISNVAYNLGQGIDFTILSGTG